jgi:hypothetical protein
MDTVQKHIYSNLFFIRLMIIYQLLTLCTANAILFCKLRTGKDTEVRGQCLF